MSGTYLRLVEASGSRVRNHMGVQMDEGVSPILSRKYSHIDIPVRLPVEEESRIIKRNQHVFIEAAASIHIKGTNVVEVEANPALGEYGTYQSGYKVHPGDEQKQLGVWFTAHKQLDLTQLTYIVRLYMIA